LKVEVDIREVEALTAEADFLLASAGRRMHEVLAAKGEEAQASHRYQNRTTTLESSTYAADLDLNANGSSVEFGARAEYASFLEARGFQDLETKAAEADAEIAATFDDDLKRLASL